MFVGLALLYASSAVADFDDAATAYYTGGDLPQFLWNLWYFKHALVDLKTSPFRCDLLFYPEGVVTALSPFHALYGLVSTPFQMAGLQLYQIYILLIVWTYAASGFFTYLLIRHFGKGHLPAFLGGMIYAFSAYRLSHVLYGQLNLAATEWIPLYALCLVRLLDRPSIRRGVLLGLAFLAQLYTSYYYSIFLMVFTVVMLLARVEWEARRFRHSARLSRALVLASLSILAYALVSSFVPAARVAALPARTLSVVGWALLAAWLLVFRRPVDLLLFVSELLAPLGAAVVCVLAGFSPALVPILSTPFDGDLSARLSSEFYMSLNLWHSVVPLPNQLVWRGAIKTLFPAAVGASVEAAAYLGLVLVFLLIVSVVLARKHRGPRIWLVCCAVFFLLTLGDALTLSSSDEAFFLKSKDFFILPLWPIFRNIPVASAVRVCTRFQVMILLCGAVASSWAAEFVLRRSVRKPVRVALGLLLCGVCFVDLMPESLKMPQMSMPTIYKMQGEHEDCYTILDLPAGFVTGSGVVGAADFRDLAYQTVHKKRLIGGIVGKIPRAVVLRRWTDPIIGTMLRAAGQNHSESKPGSVYVGGDRLTLDRLWAPEFIHKYGVRVVVLRKTGLLRPTAAEMGFYIECILGGVRFYSSDGFDAYWIPAERGEHIPPNRVVADHNSVLESLSYSYRFDPSSTRYLVRIEGRISSEASDLEDVRLMYESVRLPVNFALVNEKDGTTIFSGEFEVSKHRVVTAGLVGLNCSEIINVGEARGYVTMDAEATPYLNVKVETASESVPHFFLFSLDPENVGHREVSLQTR